MLRTFFSSFGLGRPVREVLIFKIYGGYRFPKDIFHFSYLKTKIDTWVINLHSTVSSSGLNKPLFIVPVSGIYEFTLKAYKPVIYESLEISLQVNGKAMANSWSDWINSLLNFF